MLLELWEVLEDAKDGGCNGLIVGFDKLENTRFGVTLLKQKALGRLGLEGFLLFIYPNFTQLYSLVDY